VICITGALAEKRYECDLPKHERQHFRAAASSPKEGSRDPEQASEGDGVSVFLPLSPDRDRLGPSGFLAICALAPTEIL
jgi:hypothetical protein